MLGTCRDCPWKDMQKNHGHHSLSGGELGGWQVLSSGALGSSDGFPWCPPQDEIEFGYIEAPHKGFPVVLDSPRDGNLKDFPVKQLLVRCEGHPGMGVGHSPGTVVKRRISLLPRASVFSAVKWVNWNCDF